MSMPQFATYADYLASAPAGRAATLARLQALQAEVAAEAQLQREAALWRKLVSMGICEVYEIADRSITISDFVARVEAA